MNILETPRLILRTWREADLDPMSLMLRKEQKLFWIMHLPL